ncbi:MAG TPA: hydrolase [Bacteroidales bacterium]|nr:hydrolase [Bacteroidales bacterium]
MRILKDRTTALIIDVQERIFNVIHDHEKLEKNIPLLIEGLKILHVPVFVTEQYTKGLGPTIAPVVSVLGDLKRIEKMSFSCCDEPTVMEGIAVLGRENIIVGGIESHVCVLQTVVDLKRNGYHPIVVEDCISSRRENDKRIAVERMRQEGAVITTYESLLFELLRFSGTEQFKAISRLVK